MRNCAPSDLLTDQSLSAECAARTRVLFRLEMSIAENGDSPVSRLLECGRSLTRKELNDVINQITRLDLPVNPSTQYTETDSVSDSSEFYVARPPRLPGLPNPPADEWGEWDEYRDDMDAGFRVLELPSGSDEDELLSARSGGTSSLSNTGVFPSGLLAHALGKNGGKPQTPPPPVGDAPVVGRSQSPVFGRSPSLSLSAVSTTVRFDMHGGRHLEPAAPAAGARRSSPDWPLASLQLRVEYEPRRTGLEKERDREYDAGDRVGSRYVVKSILGSGAFSSAYAASVRDSERDMCEVCLKVVKNVKDFYDQGLDEIRVLLHLEEKARETGTSLNAERIVSLHDYFYYREHLFIVTERLYCNLYEYQRFCKDRDIVYFTVDRVRSIARQIARALRFIHKVGGVMSCDLKPENVLFQSYDQCLVKMIDFGNASYTQDTNPSTATALYIQSRCYRAPEVILGVVGPAGFDEKIDIWSLGCVLAELYTGYVLFQCERVEGMLARIVGIIGEFPEWMLQQGRLTDKHFINKVDIKDDKHILVPKKTSLWQRIRSKDKEFVDFLCQCLQLDPNLRPDATQLLNHSFLSRQLTSTSN